MRIYYKEDLIRDEISAVGGGGNRELTLTTLGGTLNQYAGKYILVVNGDQADGYSLIASNTNATPTVLTVSDDQNANIVNDMIQILTDYNSEWIRISAIIDFPEITSRNNLQGICQVVLRDFEGALFDAWEAKDLIEMLVTDDSSTYAEDCNTIFRGFLTNKKFHSRDLVLELSGLGVHLIRNSFGAEEIKDYILAEGYIKGTPALEHSNKLYLQYKDAAGDFQDFIGWEDDYWSINKKNIGILVKDTTAGYSTETWDSAGMTFDLGGGQESSVGDHTDTNTYNDGNSFEVTIQNYGAADMRKNALYINADMEGIVIPDTKELKSLKVEWSYRVSTYIYSVLFSETTLLCKLQIYNTDTGWEDIAGSTIKTHNNTAGLTGSHWIEGVSEANGGQGGEFILKGTDVELQKYFNKVGADYDNLAGLRLDIYKETNIGSSAGYVKIYIDFLQVTPQFNDDDVEPIMREVTGSGIDGSGSYVEVQSVSFWDEMGLTVDVDTFQFGQNTRAIVEDIAGFAKIDIQIIDGMDGSETRTGIYPTGDTATIEWTTTGGNHYGELDDANDATYVDTAIDSEEDIYTFDEIDLHGGYVSGITIYHRQKCDVIDKEVLGISYSLDGGTTWSSEKSDDLTAAWVTENSAWTGLEITKLDDFQVKLLYTQVFAGSSAYVSELYMTLNLVMPNWNKYMARKFKAKHCIDPLRAVCNLEGGEWMEDYSNNRIILLKKADYEDSGVTLDQTDYSNDWEFEDQCNQVKYIYVWGKTSFDTTTQTTTNIYARAIDPTVIGESSIQIVDDSIWTNAEAQAIADTQLALLKDKRPSIRIPLNGIREDIKLGTTVNITMARPTVAAKDYPIRMIQRKRRGITGIETIIFAGFGMTEWDEKIINAINQANTLARRALTDRLDSTPYDIGEGGGVAWGDVAGGDAGAVAAVLAGDDYVKNTGDEMSGNLTFSGAQTVDGYDISVLGASEATKRTAAQVTTAILATKLDDLTTPDDNTDLNASTTRHGLLKKLDNNIANFMNGQGNWVAAGGGGSTVKQLIWLSPTSGATWSSDIIIWDAVGERIYFTVRTGDDWDDTQDLKFRLYWYRQDANNDTVSITKYAKGGAEGTAVTAWNIWNAVADTLEASQISKMNTSDEIVLTAANWDAGDIISVLLILNEAARDIRMYGGYAVL